VSSRSDRLSRASVPAMTLNRLLITSVVVENRPVREVAAQYGVSESGLFELLARYRSEGEAAEKVAPVGCPSCFVEWNRREVPFFKPARASVRYGTLTRPASRRSSVDPG
jgi:transposase